MSVETDPVTGKTVKRVFLGNNHDVVPDDDPRATWCRETVTDSEGRLVSTATYFTKGYKDESGRE